MNDSNGSDLVIPMARGDVVQITDDDGTPIIRLSLDDDGDLVLSPPSDEPLNLKLAVFG